MDHPSWLLEKFTRTQPLKNFCNFLNFFWLHGKTFAPSNFSNEIALLTLAML